MKPRRRHLSSAERGAALLAALCFAMVMAVALASYITVCYRSLQLSSRNVNGAHSAELAELGMEEALWALNKNDWSNGWTITGTTATKTLSSGFAYDGGFTGKVSVTVTNYASTTHTLTATGTLCILAADGVTPIAGTTQTRTLTSSSAPAPLFVNAVAGTTGLVKFTTAGTSSNIDSYDSSKGDYTAAIQSPTYNYSAILSSGSTSVATSTVQLTNAQVKGYVATLSTGPSYSTSAKLVGSAAQPAVANRAPTNAWVDLTRMTTSPYQPIFSIKTPTGTGTTLANPTTDITIGTPGVTSLYYCNGLDTTGTVKITVAGPVQLVMNGTSAFYIGLHGGANSASIEIQAGASLEVFSAGDIAIYGNGINNLTKNPNKCAIYSSNTLTAPDMWTNAVPTADFYGVIYTPNGDFKVWSNNAIYGAIIARNVTFSGSAPVVHYDLNLRTVVFPGLDTPYAVSNVRDITNP